MIIFILIIHKSKFHKTTHEDSKTKYSHVQHDN
jgi:hypothetical protein